MTARHFLVTGGAGFIGSALVRHLIAETPHRVTVLDKLTYAGNRASLEAVEGDDRFRFVNGDICDAPLVRGVIGEARPDVIVHLAAETHVDRSIDDSSAFLETNIIGTSVLLDAALDHWRGLEGAEQAAFRFHHVSTDEVFGALGSDGVFTEDSPYRPNSPYAASKAASDHLVRAWHVTYGLPVVLSNCSNNYGSHQFPEKFIPVLILNCLEGKPLPIYGDGRQVRDWLHVEDHARALLMIAEKGKVGGSYNVGGDCERTNLDVTEAVCALMDELSPRAAPARELIAFVEDRPGHDRRYAVDASRIRNELGWAPRESFETGLEKTVRWYLQNRNWWSAIRSGTYRGERLGLGR